VHVKKRRRKCTGKVGLYASRERKKEKERKSGER